MFKEILKANGIQSFIENNLMSVIEPWIVSPGGIAPGIVKVSSSDYTKTEKLIGAFTKWEFAFY